MLPTPALARGLLAQARKPQGQGVLGAAYAPFVLVQTRWSSMSERKRSIPANGNWTHRMRGATAKQFAEPRRVERISPHQRIRVGNVHDHAAPRANGVGDHRRERPRRHGTTHGHAAQR